LRLKSRGRGEKNRNRSLLLCVISPSLSAAPHSPQMRCTATFTADDRTRNAGDAEEHVESAVFSNSSSSHRVTSAVHQNRVARMNKSSTRTRSSSMRLRCLAGRCCSCDGIELNRLYLQVDPSQSSACYSHHTLHDHGNQTKM